jgi:hypothetical protein
MKKIPYPLTVWNKRIEEACRHQNWIELEDILKDIVMNLYNE